VIDVLWNLIALTWACVGEARGDEKKETAVRFRKENVGDAETILG